MPAFSPRVLADPLAVLVDLVGGVDTGADPRVIADVVQRVAAGRAKRRCLAQALLDTPSLLIDGRSPAPRVAGDLLIALRRAGAGDDLTAGVRGLREGAAHPATPR